MVENYREESGILVAREHRNQRGPPTGYPFVSSSISLNKLKSSGFG